MIHHALRRHDKKSQVRQTSCPLLLGLVVPQSGYEEMHIPESKSILTNIITLLWTSRLKLSLSLYQICALSITQSTTQPFHCYAVSAASLGATPGEPTGLVGEFVAKMFPRDRGISALLHFWANLPGVLPTGFGNGSCHKGQR